MKRDYLIIALGAYIIFEAIIGIRQNVISGLPIFLKILNWILMLAYMGIGVFLIRLKNWARIAAIVVAVIYITLAIAALYTMHQRHSLLDTNYISKIINIRVIAHFIINIFAIYYLTRPKVKEQFR